MVCGCSRHLDGRFDTVHIDRPRKPRWHGPAPDCQLYSPVRTDVTTELLSDQGTWEGGPQASIEDALRLSPVTRISLGKARWCWSSRQGTFSLTPFVFLE